MKTNDGADPLFDSRQFLAAAPYLMIATTQKAPSTATQRWLKPVWQVQPQRASLNMSEAGHEAESLRAEHGKAFLSLLLA